MITKHSLIAFATSITSLSTLAMMVPGASVPITVSGGSATVRYRGTNALECLKLETTTPFAQTPLGKAIASGKTQQVISHFESLGTFSDYIRRRKQIAQTVAYAASLPSEHVKDLMDYAVNELNRVMPDFAGFGCRGIDCAFNPALLLDPECLLEQAFTNKHGILLRLLCKREARTLKNVLYTKIREGNKEHVHALLKAGVDPNEHLLFGDPDYRPERTPLHSAVQHGDNLAIIEDLIAAGADTTQKDKYGYIPLYYAIKQLHSKDDETTQEQQMGIIKRLCECTPTKHLPLDWEIYGSLNRLNPERRQQLMQLIHEQVTPQKICMDDEFQDSPLPSTTSEIVRGTIIGCGMLAALIGTPLIVFQEIDRWCSECSRRR